MNKKTRKARKLVKKSVKITAEIKKTNENKMKITEKIKKNHLE